MVQWTGVTGLPDRHGPSAGDGARTRGRRQEHPGPDRRPAWRTAVRRSARAAGSAMVRPAGWLLGCDALSVCVAALLATRPSAGTRTPPLPAAAMLGVIVAGALITFAGLGMYRTRLRWSLADDLPRLLVGMLAAGLLVRAVPGPAVQPNHWPAVGAALLGLLALRWLTYRAMRAVARTAPVRTVVVGTGPDAARLATVLADHPEYGLLPVALAAPDLRDTTPHPPAIPGQRTGTPRTLATDWPAWDSPETLPQSHSADVPRSPETSRTAELPRSAETWPSAETPCPSETPCSAETPRIAEASGLANGNRSTVPAGHAEMTGSQAPARPAVSRPAETSPPAPAEPDPASRADTVAHLPGVPVFYGRPLADLVTVARAGCVIVAERTAVGPDLAVALRGCVAAGSRAYLVPTLLPRSLPGLRPELLDGIPVAPLLLSTPGGAGRRLKRATDLVLAALAVTVLAPVFGACALAVRVSGGPGVLFRQRRVGRDGRTFEMLKFRSLRPDTAGEAQTRWSIASDPRLGRIGRLLRATSLDELPQLLNVLRGDMSLVGPRPERPYFVDRFSRRIPDYAGRHRVRPGITGWAQIHGLRGDTSIVDRIRYDNAYIDGWSYRTDLRILAYTFQAVLRGVRG